MADFFLTRPGARPEFYTSEEWASVVLNADWTRRKDTIERQYDLARRQMLQQEWDAATLERYPVRERTRYEPTDEESIRCSKWMSTQHAALMARHAVRKMLDGAPPLLRLVA